MEIRGIGMKRVIICDDDEKAIIQLRDMIDRLFPNLFAVSGYVSARQMIYEVEDGFLKSADVLFLNMEMKEMDGMEAARILQKRIPMLKIIFVTDFPERTEKIFDEIYPFGLLLKPLRKEPLKKYLNRELDGGKREGHFVEIRKKGGNYYIPAEEIYYVESRARKLLIHKKDEIECVYERISNFCVLYEEDFVRCHQSYAVNWGQVAEVSKKGILLKNGARIPVSRQKYRDVRSRLG